MKTTVEKPEPTKVKLTIEVPAGELAPLWADTLKRLSHEVRVPGFRQGKVPKAILESRIGKEQIRQEVLKDALPTLYEKATEQEEIGPVARPEIEVTKFGENQDLTFTATVEVRADIDLPDYQSIEVAAPSGEATEEDVNNRLERLRERFGTLESVGRPAATGDFVTIDLFGSLHGENLDEISTQDFVYEIGSGMFGTKMDDELTGKRPGDIIQFNAEMPEYFRAKGLEPEELTWRAVVKEVQSKRLPPLDDEFAKVASEFDTLEELRAEIAESITRHKSKDAELAVRNMVLMHMLDHTEVPLPSSLVNKETELRLARLLNEIERSGLTFEEYLSRNKVDKETLFDNYRQTSEVTVKADLILEAVAKAEGIEVTEEDFEKEIQQLSEETKSEPEKLRKTMLKPGAVNALAGDILRRKALDFLVEHVRITEEPAESTQQAKG